MNLFRELKVAGLCKESAFKSQANSSGVKKFFYKLKEVYWDCYEDYLLEKIRKGSQ